MKIQMYFRSQTRKKLNRNSCVGQINHLGWLYIILCCDLWTFLPKFGSLKQFPFFPYILNSLTNDILRANARPHRMFWWLTCLHANWEQVLIDMKWLISTIYCIYQKFFSAVFRFWTSIPYINRSQLYIHPSTHSGLLVHPIQHPSVSTRITHIYL